MSDPILSRPRPTATLPHVPWRVRVGVRAVFALLSLAILVVSGVAWTTYRNFSQDVPHGDKIPAADGGDIDADDQNILLIGNDTRAGATDAELRALHTGTDRTTVNADTMMLMHVPGNGSRATLVSFPRDSWVDIPGYGMGKLNAAYPDGYNRARSAGRSELGAESAGIVSTIRTLQKLTGLSIDHYMQVNLLGFYRISEAIGGVQVCLRAAQNRTTETDGNGGSGFSGINLPKGVSTIKGAQALAFVRQRHGLPGGDLDRVKRQQYFLKAAFSKITSAGTLLNPFKLNDLLDAVGKSLLTDPELNLISLARQLQALTSGKITFATIPNNGPKLIYPGGVETSIVEIDRAGLADFVAQLKSGTKDSLAGATAASPSSVTVDVLNGTETAGLAARNADGLIKLGFKVATVSSTDSTLAKTTIRYPAGQEAQAKAVLAAVPKAVTELTSEVSRVTVVLGTDNRMVKGVAGPSSAPRTSGATSSGTAANGLGCIN